MNSAPPVQRPLGLAAAALLFGSGCGELAGMTDPQVARALVLDGTMAEGLDRPEDLEDALGTRVTVQLVDADGTTAEGEPVPINEATVTLTDHLDQSILAMPMGDGLFALGPDQGIAYQVGGDWNLGVLFEDDHEGDLSLQLPDAAGIAVPAEHEAGQPLTLPIDGPGFRAAAAAVYEQGGEPTHLDVPDEGDEIYDLLDATEDVAALSIPGVAFPRPGTYFVGVGALRAGAVELHDLNASLSGAFAGRMVFHVVTVK